MSNTSSLMLVLLLGGILTHPGANGQGAPTVQAAGMVKAVSGTATLERAGTAIALVAGSPVQVGDMLRTGADSAIGITLADDTLLTLGANSEFVLSDYSFDGTTHDGGMLALLWRGTVAVVTGLIGKKSPEKVRLQTRTVVLGVRGTEFIVDAGAGAK